MSTNTKVILGILIVVIVGVGAYFIGKAGTVETASVFNIGAGTTNVPSTVGIKPSPTPLGEISLQWSNGGCEVWYWDSNNNGTYLGTANISQGNCHDVIQMAPNHNLKTVN